MRGDGEGQLHLGASPCLLTPDGGHRAHKLPHGQSGITPISSCGQSASVSSSAGSKRVLQVLPEPCAAILRHAWNRSAASLLGRQASGVWNSRQGQAFHDWGARSHKGPTRRQCQVSTAVPTSGSGSQGPTLLLQFASRLGHAECSHSKGRLVTSCLSHQ